MDNETYQYVITFENGRIDREIVPPLRVTAHDWGASGTDPLTRYVKHHLADPDTAITVTPTRPYPGADTVRYVVTDSGGNAIATAHTTADPVLRTADTEVVWAFESGRIGCRYGVAPLVAPLDDDPDTRLIDYIRRHMIDRGADITLEGPADAERRYVTVEYDDGTGTETIATVYTHVVGPIL